MNGEKYTDTLHSRIEKCNHGNPVPVAFVAQYSVFFTSDTGNAQCNNDLFFLNEQTKSFNLQKWKELNLVSSFPPILCFYFVEKTNYSFNSFFINQRALRLFGKYDNDEFILIREFQVIIEILKYLKLLHILQKAFFAFFLDYKIC